MSSLVGEHHWDEDIISICKEESIKCLFVIRDLRDVAVSNFYFITYKTRRHRLHSYFQSLGSDDERLMASIRGIEGSLLPDGIRSKSLGEHARLFLPWLSEPSCCVVRFEELIGPTGGGTIKNQRSAVYRIAEHLEISLSELDMERILNSAFSEKSPTFRKGQIGDWRNHFKEEHMQAMKKTANDVLIELGYVDRFDW